MPAVDTKFSLGLGRVRSSLKRVDGVWTLKGSLRKERIVIVLFVMLRADTSINDMYIKKIFVKYIKWNVMCLAIIPASLYFFLLNSVSYC